mmetsp:Transcript_11420/g.23302  ORF Transcript_11420/g.23302 Transcript_11420/m.23302 type:complete len:101 (+) Transcript_11420:473-775(+)
MCIRISSGINLFLGGIRGILDGLVTRSYRLVMSGARERLNAGRKKFCYHLMYDMMKRRGAETSTRHRETKHVESVSYILGVCMKKINSGGLSRKMRMLRF